MESDIVSRLKVAGVKFYHPISPNCMSVKQFNRYVERIRQGEINSLNHEMNLPSNRGRESEFISEIDSINKMSDLEIIQYRKNEDQLRSQKTQKLREALRRSEEANPSDRKYFAREVASDFPQSPLQCLK